MTRKFIINVNGKSYDVEVTEVSDNQPKVESQVAVPAPVSAPAAPKASVKNEQPAANAPAGAVKITAPMPGTILKVNVEQGQSIKKGQVVLILEAMKMENEIVAPSDGVIASINVSRGSKVNAGELMVSMA